MVVNVEVAARLASCGSLATSLEALAMLIGGRGRAGQRAGGNVKWFNDAWAKIHTVDVGRQSIDANSARSARSSSLDFFDHLPLIISVARATRSSKKLADCNATPLAVYTSSAICIAIRSLH